MALIKGKEAKETEEREPANPKLWNMITAQAATRFSKNSPARGHWIHSRYNAMGGQYVNSKREVDPRLRDYAAEEQKKKEEEQKKKIKKPVGKQVQRFR